MDLIDFKIVNTAIERLLNKELAEFGITYTQATVIGYLKQNVGQEICQKDIEYNLGLTHPTVSSILKRMEEKQMITTEQQIDDHRYKRVVLTKKAIEMSNDIHLKIEKITAKLFNGVSKIKQEELKDIIKKIIKNIN